MNALDGPVLIMVNSLGGGGAETTMVAIHRQLLKRNNSSIVLSLMQDEFTEQSHVTNVINLDRKWGMGLLGTIQELRNFQKVLRRVKPKTIIANCELPELYIALSATNKSRLICVEHTSQPWKGRKLLGSIVRLALYLRGCTWVTVVKNQNRVWGTRSRPLYIPNPFLPQDCILNTRIDPTSIVYIGRLRREKRPDWVIEASVRNQCKVEIFGDGDYRQILESKYANYGQVKFHGHVKNVWGQISSANLIVIPSEYEGDGMVVVEAVLMGHPILLADNKDLRRFEFPDNNYFSSIDDLTLKISAASTSGSGIFSLPADDIKALEESRNLETIVYLWEDLLKR